MATFDVDMYLDSQGGQAGFDPDAYLDSAPAPRSMGEEALRKAEYAARGFSDSALETIGAIPDAVASGMRYVGLPAPEESFYTDALKSGWDKVGRFVSQPLNDAFPGVMDGPKSTADEFAYGAGRGAGDAASILAPAAALSNTAKAGGLTQRVAQSAATQPGLQLAGGAAAGATYETTENPWLSLAAGIAVPAAAAGAQRLAAPVRNQLSPREQETARIAKDMGIELTAGQQTGSRPLLAAESQLAQFPMSSGPQRAIYDAQRGTLNRSILSKAGIDGDSLTPEMLDDAYARIGSTMDDLVARTTINADQPFFDQVNAVAQEYGRRLPSDVSKTFTSYYDDIMQMATAAAQPGVTGVTVGGKEFQRVASSLKRAMRANRNNPPLQEALGGLVGAMDDAVMRSAGPDVASEWSEANRLYRNLMIIDDAVARGARGDRNAGDIPISGLKNAVRKSDPRGFSRGRGEFADDVRVGEFISDNIPNSGTPERSFMTGLLTGAPATGGMGMMLAGADPFVTAPATVASYGLPPLTQKLLANPAVRRYLTRQPTSAPVPVGRLTALLGASQDLNR